MLILLILGAEQEIEPPGGLPVVRCLSELTLIQTASGLQPQSTTPWPEAGPDRGAASSSETSDRPGRQLWPLGAWLGRLFQPAVMFGLISGFVEYCFKKDELHVLILGVDKAGKTTLLEKMKTLYTDFMGLEPEKILPTVGLNVGRIEAHKAKLIFWDLGGKWGPGQSLAPEPCFTTCGTTIPRARSALLISPKPSSAIPIDPLLFPIPSSQRRVGP